MIFSRTVLKHKFIEITLKMKKKGIKIVRFGK